MAAVVWKKGAFRVRRFRWLWWEYLDEDDGYWWMEASIYNAFKSAEAAEAEYVRIKPRRIKVVK